MITGNGESGNGQVHSYCTDRGENFGQAQDGQKQKHLPRLFSLIKNESWKFEVNQIPL
uniref:Uncharacterized protein n=1 Tax=Denticeps clupeoides TaxID=299321 RepID=A0AAY3ZVN4_9TELE